MQSRVPDALVTDLADVNRIGKQFIERSPEEQVPAGYASRSLQRLCSAKISGLTLKRGK
jgi:hypothetical protein